MTIQALIFDLDGLLIDSERLSQRSWSEVMADAGYTLSEEIYSQMIGRTEKDVKDILQQAYKINQEIMEELASKDKVYKKVYDSWKKFRGDINDWFKTAELTYANFG